MPCSQSPCMQQIASMTWRHAASPAPMLGHVVTPNRGPGNMSWWLLVACWSFTSGQHLRSYQDVEYFVSWCLIYIVTTKGAISRRVPTCDSAHFWRFYSDVPLGDKAPYPDFTLSPINLIQRNINFVCHRFDSIGMWTTDLPHRKPALIPNRPPCLVKMNQTIIEIWRCNNQQICTKVHVLTWINSFGHLALQQPTNISNHA